MIMIAPMNVFEKQKRCGRHSDLFKKPPTGPKSGSGMGLGGVNES